MEIDGVQLATGDGAALSEERVLRIAGTGPGQAELLVFDLA